MTEKEYRSHPAISRSELWKIRESPEKFKYLKENPTDPTPALIFGQAFHKLALQPETFSDEFAVMPQIDRRTKDGKAIWAEFCEQSEGKTVITDEDYTKAKDMVDSLYKAPFVNKLLSGEKEKEFFWRDDLTGEECKCRADCVSELNTVNIITDLKSASKADLEHFTRDAINYGYDFQSAMYTEGVEKCTGRKYAFVFIVIEKDPPYAVNVLQADDVFVKRGKDIFRELIGIYHDCKTTGDWYGYLGRYTTINSLSLPAWLAKEIE